MSSSYGDLIVCANEYISICEGNGGIVSVVEFDNSAQILRSLDNRSYHSSLHSLLPFNLNLSHRSALKIKSFTTVLQNS